MLLRSATFHNIGPWRDFKLDVGELRGLVALVAPNGTGKSSAVEIGILGGCFRMTETQGTLKARATDRDAWVEASIVHGAGYTIRQLVDGKTGESLVTNDNGEPVLHDTKLSTYDAEFAAKLLPDPEVYLAGPFCAQQSEGFVKMSSAERISVILKVRGIARLERMAKLAAKRAAKASDAFDALTTRIADARAGAITLEAGIAAADQAQAAAAAAGADVVIAKERVTELRQEAADHAVRKASRDAADRLVSTLQEQRAAALDRAKKAADQQAAIAALLAEAVAIRAAAVQLPADEAALSALRAAWSESTKAIDAELQPWRDGAQRLRAAQQRAASARARLADEGAITAAAASLDALKATAEAERGAVAGAEAVYEAVDAKGKAGSAERIAGLRAGHESILDCEISTPRAIAEQALAADDAAIAAAVAAPKALAEAKAQKNAAIERKAAADRAVIAAEKLAARAPDLVTARADLAVVEAESTEIQAGHAQAMIVAVVRAIGRASTRAAGDRAGEAIEPIRARAARLAALEAAETRGNELAEQQAAATDEAARLAGQVAAVELVEVGQAPDLVTAERALVDAETAARDAGAAQVKTQEALARAREAEERAAKLEAERDAVAATLADWNRLELDLGRKGIQSAEVDAAGPELTELANSLLRKCHGPRFTVEVKTQRLNADGKKTIDECHVRVIDSVKGTDKELRDHSGGERVILGITMRLALSMMACRTAELRDFTFVCDEGGAALDADNNRAFVAMLRHALAATGARHVLLVSHNLEVQQACDHIIEIPAA